MSPTLAPTGRKKDPVGSRAGIVLNPHNKVSLKGVKKFGWRYKLKLPRARLCTTILGHESQIPMKLTVQAHLDHEERALLRESLSPFRELPPEQHWDGAMAMLAADAPSTSREGMELMLSVVRSLRSLPVAELGEIDLELNEDAIEFLTKALSLIDRCSSYTRTESHALSQDLLPLELDSLPSSWVAP